VRSDLTQKYEEIISKLKGYYTLNKGIDISNTKYLVEIYLLEGMQVIILYVYLILIKIQYDWNIGKGKLDRKEIFDRHHNDPMRILHIKFGL
jgi:hypothetical protein